MNTPPFSISQGIVIILGYAVFTFILTWIFAKQFRQTKTRFLVANRLLGKWASAFSISATWIWAPALFIAAQKAYTQGLAGVFWFTVPNVLCLIIFAYFADIIRGKMPEGFTLSGYIRERYSKRVQNLYLLELMGLAACSFAVQLLAGGKIITALTGIPFFYVTAAMAVIALSYSIFSGLKASVITDYAQMILILLVGFTLVPWTVFKAGGMDILFKGLAGKSGNFGNILSADGLNVALTFGIPVTIGLLAGPFGDQSFWQRAFAVKRPQVKQAFIYGALIFAVVPILMSILGFIAAGKGWTVPDSATVNLETVIRLLPAWTLLPFVYMLMSGLVSTLDSNLCSISCLAGHDIAERMAGANNPKGMNVVWISRLSMLLLAVCAVAIANIPGLQILYLFLFYGMLRASTLLPTVITLLKVRVNESGIFWGILASLIIGVPVFTYGKITNRTTWIITGSLVTVLTSGIITIAASYLPGKKMK